MHAGYVIFSISNVTVLFTQAYKRCWSTFKDCNKTWTEARHVFPIMHRICLGEIGSRHTRVSLWRTSPCSPASAPRALSGWGGT